MCLNITKEAQEQKAISNIPVYKSLTFFNRSVHTDFRYWRFKKNKLVMLGLMVKRYSILIREINEGYHSRNNKNDSKKNYLFIIPKGAKFYEGSENDTDLTVIDGYVSNTIIYIGKNNMFNRWLGKILYGVKFQSEKEMKNGI